MALTICPECKGKVSDRAEFCPHCGLPKKYILLQQTETENEKLIDLVIPEGTRNISSSMYEEQKKTAHENNAKSHYNPREKNSVNNYCNFIIFPNDFSHLYDNEYSTIEWFEEKEYLEEYIDNLYLSTEEGWFYPDIDKYEEENQYYDEWTGKTYNLPFGFHLSSNDDDENQ